MSLYPVFLDLRDRTVLVIGGGPVAERKIDALLAAGARVGVGAETLTPRLRQWAEQGRVALLGARFQASWLDDAWIAIAATGRRDLNAAIAEQAGLRHIPVNVVDDPALCTFQVPAVVDRAPLMIAISTGGAAPVLARRVRERLEAWLDHSLGALVALAQCYRGRIRNAYPDPGQRRRFYDWLHDGPVAALLRRHQPERAATALLDGLHGEPPARTGSVCLVGAGPGDPGLLTLKALRALNEADVILHDRLVEPAIVAMGRRDAERIDVGKRPGEDHAATQSRIHDLLVRHARAGSRVVRLKGGDPFIFGRGGEELEALRAHGVDYEVVPGITAASACAAYAGVPLTHRGHAQSVRLVTAHCSASLDTLDWPALAAERQTLAVYMGVGQLPTLTRRLLEHGRSGDTPFALVENGSRANQRVLTGTLSELPERAARHGIRAPALLILGEVAGLATQLGWFGTHIGDARVRPAA